MEVEQQRATSEECSQSTSLNGPQPTQPTQTDPQQTRAQEKDSNSSSSSNSNISSNLVVGVQSSSSSSSREVGRRPKSGSWRDTSRKGSPGSTPSRYPQSGTQFFSGNYLQRISFAGSREGEGAAEHRGGEGPGDQDGAGGQHSRDGQVQPPRRGGELCCCCCCSCLYI